jgi:coenzyme F420-0:L-glutamate ligase/coenzyme F420-1:gamma-L-glutamate ligase
VKATTRQARLEIVALRDFPSVAAGDDLAEMIAAEAPKSDLAFADGDVVVIAQKIVSKAENQYVDLASVRPSAYALELSMVTGKDPRLVEVILGESRRVVRSRRDVLIVEHRLGYVVANAGVDQSNVGVETAAARVLCLPKDPDASAAALRARLETRLGKRVAVVINDSFGRAWRLGTVGVAIGAAGLPAVVDRCGSPDLYGRTLRATIIGFADEIAAAASLLMGQADEGRPVVVMRGLGVFNRSAPAAALIRPEAEDLFR